MGHPHGHLWTFSPGFVSQVRPTMIGDIKDLVTKLIIQTDAKETLKFGVSFNKHKELIGVTFY